MGKRLTNEDQDGERLRHDKQPKASRVTFPANVLPFLRRSVKAEATITKLKRNTDGHECREAPEESSVVHCFQCDMASGRLPPPPPVSTQMHKRGLRFDPFLPLAL